MEAKRRGDGFPDDFLWGCATASYQVEGAAGEDGRGPSIWDEHASVPGRIRDGSDGAEACDSYHRWEEDLGLLGTLGAGAYRFSAAWPRIQPEGKGRPNQAGLDYYSRLVDGLLARGIEPWLTLYHWDLPLALGRAGGWTNRDTAYRFADYAAILYESLAGRVGHWTSLNELWCSAFLGYREGEHAPGRREPAEAIAAVHHLLLAHGLASRAFTESGAGGEFGITINALTPRPATCRPADLEAARRASLERTALWFDPLFGRGYPRDYLAAAPAAMPIQDGDMELISRPLDFVGLNYYEETTVQACKPSPEHPLGWETAPGWGPKTAMGWSIEPQGLRRLLGHIAREYGPRAIYVTENGAAFEDRAEPDGRIRDFERIGYLRGHLAACRDAIHDGVPLRGYFLWSLLDNFEWAWGYTMKFGIVAVDRRSFERRPKDSFYYYRDAIAGYGLK